MRTEPRGVLMAVKLAEEQKHTVGCEYLPNNRKVVVLQNSCDCENLHSEHTLVHSLTTATYGAETRMNSAFAGGGGI